MLWYDFVDEEDISDDKFYKDEDYLDLSEISDHNLSSASQIMCQVFRFYWLVAILRNLGYVALIL